MAAIGVLPSPEFLGRLLGRVAGTTEPFPCMDHGCGCANAAECWSHCCCHTEEERAAWAIEHGVMPPESARVSDAVWTRAADRVQPRRAGEEHCAACVVGIKDRLRRGIGIRPVRVACSDGCDDAGDGCGKGACGRLEPRGVPGPIMSALSCKGVKELLVVCAPLARLGSVPLPRPPRPELVMVLGASDERCVWRALDVPEPPPKLVV